MEQTLKKRPFGVILLSLFHMVSGLIILFCTSLVWAFMDKINFIFTLMYIPSERFISAGLIASVVLVFSGVLMWRGDKWGYYLGSFHYLVSVLQNLSTLLMLPIFLASIYPNVAPNIVVFPVLFYSLYASQAVLQALIYLYFFKPSVRNYFGTLDQNKWKFLLAESIACLAIVILGLLYTIIQ